MEGIDPTSKPQNRPPPQAQPKHQSRPLHQHKLNSQSHHKSKPNTKPSSTLTPKPPSQSQLLLEITAICGEYPVDNIPRIIPAPNYRKKLVAGMVGDRLLKAVSGGGLKGYRLGFKGKRKLLEENPPRFKDYLEGGTETNRSRADHKRRMRLHSLAKVCTLMHNAGVEIFQDVKPKVFLLDDVKPAAPSQPSLSLPAIAISTPCFYTSREQKGQDDNAIRGSRAAGTLLTPTHAYAIYNTGSIESRWSYTVEQRFRAELQDYICRKVLLHQYKGAAVDGIIMGNDLETLEKYLAPKEKQNAGYHFITKVFQSFFFITNDTHGEIQLKLLCDKPRADALFSTLSKGLKPPNITYPIEHDALTEDGDPVLFCCLLDIPRLIRFRNGIALHGKMGRVIAFDFQKDMLGRYLGDMAEITAVKFERLTEWLFPKEQTK